MELFMGDYSTEEGKLIKEWFTEKVGYKNFHDDFSYIGFKKNNEIKAISLFDYYHGGSIEWHFYGKNCLTREVISCIHNYVFEQLKCNIMIVRPARASDLHKVIRRLGFKYLSTIPKFYIDSRQGDALLYYADKNMFGHEQLKIKELV